MSSAATRPSSGGPPPSHDGSQAGAAIRTIRTSAAAAARVAPTPVTQDRVRKGTTRAGAVGDWRTSPSRPRHAQGSTPRRDCHAPSPSGRRAGGRQRRRAGSCVEKRHRLHDGEPAVRARHQMRLDRRAPRRVQQAIGILGEPFGVGTVRCAPARRPASCRRDRGARSASLGRSCPPVSGAGAGLPS